MQACICCGMPIEKEDDLGADIAEGAVCCFCVDENDEVKSCEEVFDGGVEFFMNAVPGMERNFAERICRKNMRSLPYWDLHGDECLEGDVATDEEFQEALSKL